MEWLAQALSRQEQRRKDYLSNLASQDMLALDDPRMAGVNPGIDQMLAEVAAKGPQRNPATPQAALMAQAPQPVAPESMSYNTFGGIGEMLAGLLPNMPDLGKVQTLGEMLGGSPQMPTAQQSAPVGGQQLPPSPNPVAGLEEQLAAALEAANMQNPAQAPMQQAQTGQQDIIAQLQQSAQPMPEALPSEFQSTIAQVLGNEPLSAQSSQTGLGQSREQGSGGQPKKASFLGTLSDPGLSKFLLTMGAALSEGTPFGRAVEMGVTARDQAEASLAEAPFKARKREADLSKTVAETIKSIAEAGGAEAKAASDRATAGRTKTDTSLAGYEATTNRLKAQAAELSARAAYKQAGTAASEAAAKLTGGNDVVSDEDYARLMSGVVEAANSNIILGVELKTKGIDTLEFATGSLNKGMKNPANHRYLPLPPTKAADMQQQAAALRAMQDGPETQKAVKEFEDRLTEYKLIYGRDALTQIFRQQQ